MFSLIPDKPTPTKHIWMLGDELLEGAANNLRKLMNQHALDTAKPELYIHSEYHVEAFHDSEIKPTYNNILRKVRNNFTAALNKFPTALPDYIVVLMGNSYVHDQTFVEFELKPILKRMFNDITRLLSVRREQLPRALHSFKSSQVYIVRPLPKPAAALKGDQRFKNTRRYLNQMLDNLSRTHDFKPLNIDEINCSQRALFEKNGSLSDYGKERMWVSISDSIQARDAYIKSSLRTSFTHKQDAGTQVKPDMIIEETSPQCNDHVEEYFTVDHNRHTSKSRKERAPVAWSTYTRRDNFDDYHRRFDYTDRYTARNEHYNY